MTQITPLYAIDHGTSNNGQKVTMLVSTHWIYNGHIEPKNRTETIKEWYFTEGINDTEVTEAEILHEVMLNDWSRWNTQLIEGQKVEVSENIYWHLLGCVPPRIMKGNYFEVGEPHHHDSNGKAICRACWIENGTYYTGYPKN